MALDGACRAVIQMSFLTCMATAFHPVVAVLIALFFNEGMFYQLKFLVAGAIAADGSKPLLMPASVLCDAFYLVMPMADPLSKQTESVYRALRASSSDWLNLGITLGYSVLLSAFLFLVSDYMLRRKRLT